MGAFPNSRHALRVNLLSDVTWFKCEKCCRKKTIICYHFNDEDENDDPFLDILMFSDEAFHINCNCNRQFAVFGQWEPTRNWEHERDFRKIHLRCALRKTPINSPLCLEVTFLNGECYLEMQRNYFIPELKRITLLLLLSVGLPVANAPDVLQPCGLLYYP